MREGRRRSSVTGVESDTRPFLKASTLSPQRGGVTVYTVGHSNRSISKFSDLLKKHRVETLIDVRRFPTSKVEHFKGEEMKRWLSERGVRYIWLGNELGGYRRGGYKAYTEKEAYRKGIQRLLELARQGRVAVMCLEVSPKGCHRRYISQSLRELGVRVLHIIKEDTVVERSPSSTSTA